MSVASDSPELRAIYYPHNRLDDEAFLKHALLFWDKVEVISPREALRNDLRSPELREAADLIEVRREPARDASERVQQRVLSLLSEGVKEWMREPLPREIGFPYRVGYPIYLSKFPHQTWYRLKELGLASFDDPDEPETNPAIGLLLMGMLAEEMGGSTRDKITDRHGPYQWVASLLARENGGQLLPATKVAEDPEQYRLRAMVEIPVISLDRVPLGSLTRLRAAEERDPGMREMRVNYAKLVKNFVDSLQKTGLTGSDVENLKIDFDARCRRESRELSKALSMAENAVFWNDKVWAGIYMAVTAFVGAGGLLAKRPEIAAVASVSGVAAVEKIAGLWRVRQEHRQTRDKVLQQSPISWRYLADSGAS